MENGIYSFEMPEDDVIIVVKHASTESPNPNEINNDNNVVLIISIISGAVLAAGISGFVLLKKKKE